MHPILLYLLKMLLCSGILYGYYRVALYNERFHQWNRFYLLGAMLLSIIVPLVEIPLVAAEQPQGLIYVIETLPASIVAKAGPIFSTEQIIRGAVLLVSFVLLVRLAWGIYLAIYKPYRTGEVSSREDIDVVITETPSAPYSFFRLLFWRSDMDPDSPHGKRVLLHELTHIREKHSADKLFAELLLVIYWFNPFFWLIRKELYVIHEFLADRKAIEQNNGAAFAEMILQTMNAGHLSPLTNPFFSSHLKRRLKMITTSKKPQFSYLRRISALAAMVTLSFVLMLTIEKGMAQQAPPPPPPPPPPPVAPPPPPPPPPPQKISLPDSIKSVNVVDRNGHCTVKIVLKSGKVRTMPLEDAIKKGYPIPPPPPPAPAPPAPPAPPAKPSALSPLSPISPPSPPSPTENPEGETTYIFGGKPSLKFEKGSEPLVTYAGLIISQEQLNQINPKDIESIEVLKGEKAIAAYGEKGKNGVIKITPKAQSYTQFTTTGQNQQELVVTGFAPKTQTEAASKTGVRVMGFPLENPPLFVLDGKIITGAEMAAINPDNIARVNVLKDQKATEAYGEKGKNGVVEIELKKEPLKL